LEDSQKNSKEEELLEGQYYWCVYCGHHGNFGYHRKRNVKCEICSYENICFWTLEDMADPILDDIYLERFKTKEQVDKKKTETKVEISVQDRIAEIRKL
jgi:hypothetical protein